MKALHIIHIDKQETKRQIKEVDLKISQGRKVLAKTFAEKYELILPLETIDDFIKMETSLESNIGFKADFVSGKNKLSFSKSNLYKKIFQLIYLILKFKLLETNTTSVTGPRKNFVLYIKEYYKTLYNQRCCLKF